MLLEVAKLDAFYGDLQALHGLDIEVERGESVALVGANGAGKTTFMRCMAGLIEQKRGAITQDVLAAVDPEGHVIGAPSDARELAGAIDGIEHQPEIVRHRRRRYESRHHDVGVVELGEFHEAEDERFGKPVRVAKRIVGIERDVIDPARARATRDVALRPVGHSWFKLGGRAVALRFPEHLVQLAAR